MIRFDNVSKTYHIRKFEKQVFSNLNFAIRRGESIGICGANGAGKSTLTGADNVRFIARIYRQPERETLDYVEDFAQLGAYFHQPVRTYSSGMQGRLAFGTSLAINFDCYLVDEVTGAGDERFRRRSQEELFKRRESGTLVMVSHDPHMLQQYCDRGAVLYGGNLTFFDTVAEACEVHHGLQMRAA